MTFACFNRSIINRGSQISFLGQQSWSQYCKEIQIELLVPFQRGASLKCLVIARSVADYCCICRPLDSVFLVFSGQKPFWKHLHLPLAYSLSSAYKQSTRYFQSHRVNTTLFENVQTSPLKLTNERIRLFPERSAEVDFQIYLEMYCLYPSTLLISL